MEIKNSLRDIVNPIIEAKGAFLIDINIHRTGPALMLEFFIDTDTGVTTGLCAEISREISRIIDAADAIRGRYNLVVSSPGLERPLRFLWQFPRNLGREFRIKYRSGDEVETVTGLLAEINGEELMLKLNNNEIIKIYFPSVVEAKVNIKW